MTEYSIVVENLGKNYGDFQALDGISFKIRPGEIVGFLGPNGAGKSTTMKILTCFMAPSKGRASVCGFDVYKASKEVRKRIGYLPESVPLYDDMMVFDYLKFIAEVRAIPSNKRQEAIKKVVSLTGLTNMITRDIGELSKGYRQRVGLAQAIIHEPDVIILDEPTSGLDPNQILEIRDLIKEIGKEKTVIFSTHILQEVAAICDRIIVLNEGRIVADDSVEGLEKKLIDVKGGLIVETLDGETGLGNLEGVISLEALEEKNHFRLETKDIAELRKLIYETKSENIVSLYPYRPSLEDIFRYLTSQSYLSAQRSDLAESVEREEEE